MGKFFLCKVVFIYINGLMDKEILGNFIIERLMNDVEMIKEEVFYGLSELGIYIKEYILIIMNVGEIMNFDKFFFYFLFGEIIVLVDGWNCGFVCVV